MNFSSLANYHTQYIYSLGNALESEHHMRSITIYNIISLLLVSIVFGHVGVCTLFDRFDTEFLASTFAHLLHGLCLFLQFPSGESAVTMYEPVVMGTLVFPDTYLGKIIKICEVNEKCLFVCVIRVQGKIIIIANTFKRSKVIPIFAFSHLSFSILINCMYSLQYFEHTYFHI